MDRSEVLDVGMLLGALVRELQLAMLKERTMVDGRLAIRAVNAVVESLAKNAAAWKELGVSNPEEAVHSIGLWRHRIVNRDDDLPEDMPADKALHLFSDIQIYIPQLNNFV